MRYNGLFQSFHHKDRSRKVIGTDKIEILVASDVGLDLDIIEMAQLNSLLAKLFPM